MQSQGYRARRAGSVRFAPYYKLQWFDPHALAWRDVQQAFPTPQAALEASLTQTVDPPRAWRIMEITMHGRRPLAS